MRGFPQPRWFRGRIANRSCHAVLLDCIQKEWIRGQAAEALGEIGQYYPDQEAEGAKTWWGRSITQIWAWMTMRPSAQDMRRGVSVAYVLWDTQQETLAGFYTLSTGSVEPTDLPTELAKRLPRYEAIPVMMLGRLALLASESYHGRGLGSALLINAVCRARQLSREIGAVGVVVDAKDEQVRSFYENYGFLRFPSLPSRLVIAMGTIDQF